jgi:hypothetical protein
MNNAKTTQTFNNRIENVSNITLTREETQLLNKGLKYNLHYKLKNWIETLAMEAETAITQLNLDEQAYETMCNKQTTNTNK